MIDQQLKLAYVGALSEDDTVVLASGAETVGNFARRLRQQHQQQVSEGGAPIFRKQTIVYKGRRESYYSYTRVHQVKHYGKVRLVINHRQADLSDRPKYFISNRLKWQAGGITRIARHRWSIEVYHEEGKAEGLDQYQLRDFEAVYRHVALVAVVYSLLRRAQYDRDLLNRLQRHVEAALDDSPASKRRTTQAQALSRPGGLHQCVARAGDAAEGDHGAVAARGCLLRRWPMPVRTVDALAQSRRAR